MGHVRVEQLLLVTSTGAPLVSLLELHCHVDNFYQRVTPSLQAQRLPDGKRRHQRGGRLSPSGYHYCPFKSYYTEHVQAHLRVQITHWSFTRGASLSMSTSSAYSGGLPAPLLIDSALLTVSDNYRIQQHVVFLSWTAHGRGSMIWCFGFRLHLVVKDQGALLACCFPPAD